MRPKIYLPVLGLAALALALLWAGKSHPQKTPATTVAKTNSVEEKPLPAAAAEPVVLTPSPTVTVTLPAATATVTAEDLQSLAMNSDPESLQKILAALTSPDPEIRTAAREAAVQFGDRTAATKLRTVAADTADPSEKAALLEAASFLELPSLDTRSATNRIPAKPPVNSTP